MHSEWEEAWLGPRGREEGEEENHRKIQNTTTTKQNPKQTKNKRTPTTGYQNLERKTTKSKGDEHQLRYTSITIHGTGTKIFKDFHSVYRSSFMYDPEHSLFIQRSLL